MIIGFLGVCFAAQVQLLSAGNEPRTLLRYAPSAPQTFQAKKTTDSVFSVAGLPDPDATKVTQVTRWRLTPVFENGGIQLRAVLQGASLEAVPQAALPPLESWLGLTGRLRFDDRGLPLSASWSGQEGQNSEEKSRLKGLRSSMEQVMLPLPEEPVGVGAVWTVKRTLNTGVLQVQAVMTYTWEKGAAEAPHLVAKVAARGVQGEVEVGGATGFKGQLQSLSSRGTQRVDLRLDRVVPMRIDGATHTDATLKGWKGFIPLNVGLQVDQTHRATASD